MAVYKRTYHAYSGPLTAPRWRFLVISRYCLRELFQSRIFTGALLLSYIPLLVFAALVYVINSPVAQAALQVPGGPPFGVDNAFFLRFLETTGWLAMLVCAYGAPGLVSMDLANNALPLYLSRPLSRSEYVLGKATVVGGVLATITILPALLLYLMQASMAGGAWGWNHLDIVGAILLGSLLWISFLTLLSLAISAYVRWRIIATGAIVALMFLPAAFGVAVMMILRTRWGLLFNVPYLNTLIWHRLFRVPLPFAGSQFGQVPLESAWMVFLGLTVLSLWMLQQRIRAREVVRG